MLPFLSAMIARAPKDGLIERLTHTAFDELIIIDLETDTYEGRYHTDGKFFMPALSNSFRQLLEYASTHMVHPDDLEKHSELLNPVTLKARFAAAEPAGILSDSIRYLAMDGTWRQMDHLLICGTEYGLEENRIWFYRFDEQEIRDREEGHYEEDAASAERLRVMMPDLLTETTFFALAQEQIRRLQGQWCMIAVDIKHFKLFKELNSQEAGEKLLVRFAEHIHDVAELAGGLACYRGQDDFGLMIPFDQNIIDRLFSTLNQAINQLSGTSGFHPIFGICMILDTDSSALEQFNHAALTAEEIKDDLQYHIRIYDPDTHERHVEEFKILSDFREAIGTDQICFHLQPQVNVETGKIVGAESLARWQKPDGTVVSPTVFVPVLEKYGLITDLDSWIWEQVCIWLSNLIAKGIHPVPISVNVSRINIFAVDVPEYLTQLMEKYQLDPGLLEVEITESAYIEDEKRIQNTVTELRRRGFRVLMDDFGSGYSSLNMLRTVCVDIIKLDAQFLRFSIGEEQKGINILEAIINMTKSLSTPMIVEGVETPALVRYLKDLGVRYMQGFYYFRPMPANQFEMLISVPGTVDYTGIVLQHNEQMHIREFLDGNIYSDAMLNNILGPVAFYGWKEENVDIIRFNAQFVRLIGLDAEILEERRYHIQHFFVKEDRQKFFDMLKAAMEDKINGAESIVRVYKPDGSIFWMQVHVYYLRDDGTQKIFYGAAKDMSEIMRLRDQMKNQ